MGEVAIEPSSIVPGRTLSRVAFARDWRPAIAVGALAALAIAIQSFWLPLDADVSWLITVCDRLLSGDRLYVDIVELNPPASVWIYLPMVWLAKILAVKAEAVVVLAFVAGAFASIAATMKLASRLEGAPPPAWTAAVLAFFTLVFPLALFAQREHAALLLALPALTALALLAEGKPLGRWQSLACGFAAGLVLVIKPYFAPAILAPALWAAWKRKSLRPLAVPVAAAAAAVALYAVAIAFFASDYFRWAPVIARLYAPMHLPLWKVVAGPTLFPAICFACALLLRAPRIPSLAIAWALGSAGFICSVMLQAKNYPNHLLPGAALAGAAGFVLLSAKGIAAGRRPIVGAALAFIAACEMYGWAIRPDPAVAADVERNRPDVVLVDRDSKHWLMQQPAIAGAMKQYRFAAEAADVEIWVQAPR